MHVVAGDLLDDAWFEEHAPPSYVEWRLLKPLPIILNTQLDIEAAEAHAQHCSSAAPTIRTSSGRTMTTTGTPSASRRTRSEGLGRVVVVVVVIVGLALGVCVCLCMRREVDVDSGGGNQRRHRLIVS